MKTMKIRYIWRASLLMVLALTAVMASGVLAVRDGRINEVAHAGGHVLYCWDGNGLITNDYSTGRIVALSPDGQLLLEADGAELSRLVALANAGELPETQLVTTATDRFGTGEISLWVLTTGNFMLTGTDEHGKAFDFQWRGCQPISAPTANKPEDSPNPCEVNPEAEACIAVTVPTPLPTPTPDSCENVESPECFGELPDGPPLCPEGLCINPEDDLR